MIRVSSRIRPTRTGLQCYRYGRGLKTNHGLLTATLMARMPLMVQLYDKMTVVTSQSEQTLPLVRDKEQEQPPPQILACSSATDENGNNIEQPRRHWKRKTFHVVRHILHWSWKVYRVTTRFALATARFTPLVALVPAATLTYVVFDSHILTNVTWGYTIRSLRALGHEWRWAGVWISKRRDLFPESVCDRLSKLE